MKTYAIIILDKSGSMGCVRERTVSDYNEKVQMYKNVAKEGKQEVLVGFVSFNEHLFEHLWLKPVEELQEATQEDYDPNGSTALNDAVGYTLSKLKEELKLEKDDAVLVTIITDGEENASEHYRGPAGAFRIKQLIQELQATGQWTITYIGANQDVEAVADRYGIHKANCAVYSTRSVGTVGAAYSAYNARAEKFLRSRASGVKSCDHFLSDDGELADYCDLEEEKK